MRAHSLYTLLFAACTAAKYPVFQSRQNNATAVPSTVEQGVQTECKTCPYSLCTNKVAYEYNHDMLLTCWTRGDSIVETNVWYETTDGCYVTEWDIIDGNCRL